MSRTGAWIAAWLALAGAAHAQRTLRVPSERPSIQAAIVGAVNGDTVLVAPGTYRERLDFLGKAIAVESEAGPTVTVIDGDGGGPVVSFVSGEGRSALLRGFTVRNGRSDSGNGGGIRVSHSSPTIVGNRIVDNTACDGAGIGVSFGSPRIEGNVVSQNRRAGCMGSIGGGGIAIVGTSTAEVVGNTITGNSTTAAGGGIALASAGSPVLRGNDIRRNAAATAGGGVSLTGASDALLVQNWIAGNTAPEGGGLWWVIPSSGQGPLLVNNTIADNEAGRGSGIYSAGFDARARLVNNVIVAWPGQDAVHCADLEDADPPSFRSNDVFSALGRAFAGSCADPTGTDGNLSVDPLFVDPTVGNYHLRPDSPCIDQGDNAAPAGTANDADGEVRVFDGDADSVAIVDIGADEYVGETSVTLSTDFLDFGTQRVGSASPPLLLAVANTGSVALHVSAVTTTGDFSATDNCRAAQGIGPGQSCRVEVRFLPTRRAARGGTLAIAANAVSEPVGLSGVGVAPDLTLSPASLSFEDRTVGTASPPRTVTLSNVGELPLVVSSAEVSGDFALGSPCTVIAAGAACELGVTFRPTRRGERSGSLTIRHDGLRSPHVVPLVGKGIGPEAEASPATLSFDPQRVRATSPARSLALRNAGEQTLEIRSISVDSAEWAQTNDCPGALAPAASCAIGVTFTPALRGPRSGSLSIATNGVGSPTVVGLSGAGIAPTLTISERSLSFGPRVVGVSSLSRSLTLTNEGDLALAFRGITLTNPDDFAFTSTCADTLAIGASCALAVTFTPGAAGERTGSLLIDTDATAAPETVLLSGTGIDFAVEASPTTVSVRPGGSATVAVTIRPRGGAFDAAVTLACSSAPPGASCAFSPATVTPGDDAAGSTATITIEPPALSARVHGGSAALLALAVVLAALARRGGRRLLLLGALTAGLACGGGSTAPPPANRTYEVAIRGTSGNLVRTATVTVRLE